MNNQRRGETHVNLDNLNPRALLRLQRLARELRLTDQILSLDLDTVVVQPSGPAPAWTTLDGDKVSFAMDKMPSPKDRLDIAVWLGTNAHELGHVLFSPRRTSTLMYRVLESERAFLPGIAMMHNIVEDQRQERLVLARFAPWHGYLTAALGHHLVADDNSAWLLMAGRTWLPNDVRAQAKARMLVHRGPHDTAEVTRLVGEYQRLTDPGESEADEAWEILQALHAMFEDEPPTGGTGCGGGVIQEGEPDTDTDGEGGWPTADEDADPGDGGGDDDGDDTDGGDEPSPQGDSGAGDGDSDGDDDGDGEGERTGGSAGNQPGDPTKPIDKKQLRDALKDAAREQLEQDDVKGDIDAITDALDHGRAGDQPSGDDPVGTYHDATDSARLLWHEVSDALLDLKDDAEPGWNRRVDSGKLVVRRMVNPNVDPDEMFDRYEPGMMDSSELEVVMLLDVSGSMQANMLRLSESAWAIRHAVDDLEGRITVISFESGPHRIFALPDQRPDERMFVPLCTGGTTPTSAIREAYRLLAGSEAKNRLFIIVTDGDWYGSAGDKAIDELNKVGVTTVSVLLPSPYGGALREDHHGCQYGRTITDPADIARLFRTVATDRITSWRR